MYGGGNIGRGFIGALFSESGYEVTFIDVVDAVVKELQEKRSYPLRYVTSAGNEDVLVTNVTAVNGNLPEAVEVIANCDILATAVGARILKFIVPNIVAGIRRRWELGKGPLNIIICENLMDANKIVEGMIKEKLTAEECAKFDETVGLVEASIGRMVPVQTDEMKDGEPLRVCVEHYGFLPVDQAAFKGEIPETAFERLATALELRTGRPAIVTAGDKGCYVSENGKVKHVPAVKVTGEIDFCGAGDTFLSGLAASLAGGFRLADAAAIACCCSSVTIKKLKTTGTADRRELARALRDY